MYADQRAAPEIDLLFVHVPKTGGTSVKLAIFQQFGVNNVYSDYEDEPGNPLKPMSMDPVGYLARTSSDLMKELNGRRVVAGHLWLAKYAKARIRCCATVLRHPISRTISHYYYWRASSWPAHPVHKYVIERGLSLEEFARLPMIKHLYTKLFFRGVDMKRFDVLLKQEELRAKWTRVSKVLGVGPALPEANKTAELTPEYRLRIAEVLEDAARIRRLRDILAKDIRFYESCFKS